MRAAIEGVCQQMALVLASVRDAGNEVEEVRATGGFARSACGARCSCDALGHRSASPGATKAAASARHCWGWRRSA